MLCYMLNLALYSGHNLHFNGCIPRDCTKSGSYGMNIFKTKMNLGNTKIPFGAYLNLVSNATEIIQNG
jgi:hypothetical protein